MKYKIKSRDNFFVREDGNASLVLFKERNDQFLLNSTGLFMFNLILENTETETVLDELVKTYRNVELAILENDLQDIIRMLKIYDILSVQQEQSIEIMQAGVMAADENDYEKIGCFIENNRCKDYYVAGGKGYYKAVNMRMHVMNDQEYYYVKINASGNIEGAIVVSPSLNGYSVVNVTALVISKDKTKEERLEIGKELLEYVRKSMVNPVNKFRVTFYANSEKRVAFLNMFEDLGFEKEAELRKEHGEQSMFFYSFFV